MFPESQNSCSKKAWAAKSMTKKKGPPLAGLRIVVGRARHQASALSSGLRELGAEVIEIPFIEIRKPRSYKPLDTALKNLQRLRLADPYQREWSRSALEAAS